MIKEFQGENRFLSNFYYSPLEFEGLLYKNVESAFQSAKTLDLEDRKRFCNMAPNIAKSEGKSLTLRDDWDEVKDDIMYTCVRNKFLQNEDLLTKLLDTGDEELVEGNWWNDSYWGVCFKIKTGLNKLGQILMQVREDLKPEEI